MIVMYKDQEFDSIEWRILPYRDLFGGGTQFSLIEEKILNGKVVADLHRYISPEAVQKLFASVKEAVNYECQGTEKSV